jgi:hypothetical protein
MIFLSCYRGEKAQAQHHVRPEHDKRKRSERARSRQELRQKKNRREIGRIANHFSKKGK